MKQAKANLVAANADAVAENKIVAAKSDASADKNSADYKVALEKCDALAGPGKDACVKNAKSQFNQ